MDDRKLDKVIIILGTTAVGKTKLSVELAQQIAKHLRENSDSPSDDPIKAEIISEDSVQVYRGMEICSDANTEGERITMFQDTSYLQ